MSNVLERQKYWLEGASAVPFITRRKVLTILALTIIATGLLVWVTVSYNPIVLVSAIGLAIAAVLVWLRRDVEGDRWVVSAIGAFRRVLARHGRWDEFDPAVETRPFWLNDLRVLAVSGSEGGSELAILDEGQHFVAVLEVDGGGEGIQTVANHIRRERAFSDVLRATAQPRTGITQVDFITRAVPAQDEDVASAPLAPWVTPAVAASMQQLADDAKKVAQQVRSWVTIRIAVDHLEDRVRDQGLRPNDETLCEAALDTVSQFTRLLVDHGIDVHRGLSPRRLAAVTRGILLPSRSIDDTTGIRDFWDAWPAFRPTDHGEALMVFDPITDRGAWCHATGTIPRRGWPTTTVSGRWLAPLVLNNRLSHRIVMTSFELIPQAKAMVLARDQLTTAASMRIRERNQGKVSLGDKAMEESSAHIVGEDLAVRQAAGLRVVTRLMVSAPTLRRVRRAKEDAELIAANEMGVTKFWWDDGRHALGVLATLPMGKEIPHDH